MIKNTFNRELLLQKLKKCIQFIPKKAVIPAHEDFYFDIKSGQCHITAMDSEKQITTPCDIKGSDGDTTFCIPAKLLLSTLNLLIEEDVVFVRKEIKAATPADMDRCIVEVRAGKSKYNINCDKGNSYPKASHIESEFEASFTGSDFNSAMETVMRFSDPEGNQPFKQGVCMRLMDRTINAYGTDGFKISKIEMSPRSINKWDDIVIPVFTVRTIVKCIGDIDIVDITHNKNKIEIRTDDVVIIALAYDLKYPDVETFFKMKSENKVTLNTVQFYTAVERIKLYSKEEMPSMKMNILTTNLELNVDNDTYNRDAHEILDVISQKDLSITLNPVFVNAIIESFKSDEFDMFYSEPNAMVHIEPSSTVKDNNKFFGIMPIK